MKNRFIVLLPLIISLVFCSACEQSFIQKENSDDHSGLEMDIFKISLNAKELATIPGRNLTLTASVFPRFATRNQLCWVSSDAAVAAVDASGNITVKTAPVTVPEASVIRVYSEYDPSVYALCTVTVYPSYPGSRSFGFPENPVGNAKYPADTNGDLDLGNGIFLLLGTGGASEYTPGNKGPGVYVIDPENPYEYGIVPNGNPRELGGTTPWESGGFSGFSSGHIRTAGNAARQIKIAALFGPFEVKVNYMTNSGGSPRNVDIRIGDTEGLRIEGETSSATSPGDGKTVSYRFESNEFVPVIYVECNQGVRIYDVIVNGL